MKPRSNPSRVKVTARNTPTQKRAVIYCRVSTKEQAQTNLSLPTQRKVCEDYCQREGFAVDRIFMEKGASAKTIDRPEFQTLLSYCRENKGRIHVVVVYDVSRFARDNTAHYHARALLSQYGVTLKSATQSIDDTSAGTMMEGILSTFAYFDNKQKSERTVRGMKAALADGRWTFSPPLGYRKTSDASGRSTIEPDPERAPLIQQAFELFATGLHTKTQVLRIVTDLGLRTVRNGSKVSMQTFQQTLRNPIYAGWLTVKSWGLEPQRGNFEPLVTDQVFEMVQAVLDGKKVSVTPHIRSHPDFPLRHFARCGACGTPLTASWSKGRKKHYAYYRCPKSNCRAVNATKVDFENDFVSYLGGLKPKPEVINLFHEIVLDVWKQKQADTIGTTKTLDRRLHDLQARKGQLVDAFVYRKVIDEATYQEQNDRLAEEIALAEMELHDARLDELDVEGVLNFAEHVLSDASRLWMACSPEQKQRLQKTLFPGGVVYSNRTFGTTEISLIFRMLRLVPSQDASNGSSGSKGAFGTTETALSFEHLGALDAPEIKRGVPDGI